MLLSLLCGFCCHFERCVVHQASAHAQIMQRRFLDISTNYLTSLYAIDLPACDSIDASVNHIDRFIPNQVPCVHHPHLANVELPMVIYKNHGNICLFCEQPILIINGQISHQRFRRVAQGLILNSEHLIAEE